MSSEPVTCANLESASTGGSLPSPTNVHRTFLRWLVASVGLSLLCTTTFAGWALYRFGSIRFGLAYLAGEPLAVNSRNISLGTIERFSTHEAPVTITNLSNHTLKVLGSRSTCSCTIAKGLPLTIPPGGKQQIMLQVRPIKADPQLDQTVQLYFDQPSMPTIGIRVRASIHDTELSAAMTNGK